MAETPVPITPGSGGASIAGDLASGRTYQQIKVVDGTIGSENAWIINSDGTANIRVSGSVATSITPAANQSVSGTVGASVIGTVPTTQSGISISSIVSSIPSSVLVGASIFGALPGGNNILGAVAASISGTVTATLTGSPSISGAVTVVGNPSISGTVNIGTMPSVYGNISGSVFAVVSGLQGASVSGTLGASILGYPAVNIGGSIAGTYSNSNVASTVTGVAMMFKQNISSSIMTEVSPTFPLPVTFGATANQSVSGTVGASIIGIIPVQFSNSSLITVAQGSIATVIIGGSIAASFTPPANQSVSGTVQTDIRGSVATVIIGGSIAASFTPPANQSVSGAVSISNFPTTQNVSGSVVGFQGTNPWVVVSSLAGGIFPISGSVAAVIIGTPNVNTAGSVIAFQGTSPWVVNYQNSSILAIPVGSIITIFGQSPSIIGTYAEDSAANSGDKGIFSLNVRNDTLSSVTSNDGDYGALSLGPVGEGIFANAPITKWISGTADFRQGNTGASILITAAQSNSVFSYITGLQIANMGSASVLVTLASGGSILGYSIAPAGGGSNIYYQNALKTPQSFGFAASISGVASVLVSAQGFISKT